MHHVQIRLVIVRDIYHREWNDCNNALMDSGLWWICLITRIPFNQAYGPWNGSKWWQNTKAGAKELCLKESTASPLFQELYPGLCKDLGGSPVGTEAHMSKVLEGVASSEVVGKKGERVALRRWFSWMKSAAFHLKAWHTSILIHTFVCMHLGLFRSAADLPLFAGRSRHHLPEEAEDPEEVAGEVAPEAREDQQAAAGLEPAARRAGRAAAGEAKAEEDKGLVSVVPESSEEVRRKAKNTLVASLAVMPTEGMCFHDELIGTGHAHLRPAQ